MTFHFFWYKEKAKAKKIEKDNFDWGFLCAWGMGQVVCSKTKSIFWFWSHHRHHSLSSGIPCVQGTITTWHQTSSSNLVPNTPNGNRSKMQNPQIALRLSAQLHQPGEPGSSLPCGVAKGIFNNRPLTKKFTFPFSFETNFLSSSTFLNEQT